MPPTVGKFVVGKQSQLWILGAVAMLALVAANVAWLFPTLNELEASSYILHRTIALDVKNQISSFLARHEKALDNAADILNQGKKPENEVISRLMKENLNLVELFAPKGITFSNMAGGNWGRVYDAAFEKEGIAAFNIKSHPDVADFGHYRGPFKNPRVVIMADGTAISAADIGLGGGAKESMLNLRQVREEAERQAVTRVLGRANGNLTKAAELLGISRPPLYELLDRFGLR